jgi:hypothetical protein
MRHHRVLLLLLVETL